VNSNKVLIFAKMLRIWFSYLQLLELFVSSLVHLLYGFYIFSSAVAGDLSMVVNEYFQKDKMKNDVVVQENLKIDEKDSKFDNDLPPIVLVHGIFGFGKGVMIHQCPFVFLFVCFVSVSKLMFFLLMLFFDFAEVRWFIIFCWSREER
jgi:hypothetical protein